MREVCHPRIGLDAEHAATGGLELACGDTGAAADVEHFEARTRGNDLRYQGLGHGSLRTTEKYLYTLPDTDNTALNALHRTRTRTENEPVEYSSAAVEASEMILRWLGSLSIEGCGASPS